MNDCRDQLAGRWDDGRAAGGAGVDLLGCDEVAVAIKHAGSAAAQPSAAFAGSAETERKTHTDSLRNQNVTDAKRRGTRMAKQRTDAQIVEEICRLELESLSDTEISGGYASLCGLILIRTALASRGGMGGRRYWHREAVAQRAAAQRWVNGGGGVWTFRSVCESLGMDVDYARRAIDRYAEVLQEEAINTPTMPRFIFGKPTSNALCEPDSHARDDADADVHAETPLAG